MTTLNTTTLNNWKNTLTSAQNLSATQQTQLVAQYYHYLSSNNVVYGSLAYQASQNTGFAGSLANNYMMQIAEKNGITLTDPTRQSIMLNLAIADVGARLNPEDSKSMGSNQWGQTPLKL